MGNVTSIDFRKARAPARAIPAPDPQAVADQLVAWWFSPAVRILLFAAGFGVLLGGLAVMVLGAALLAGAL